MKSCRTIGRTPVAIVVDGVERRYEAVQHETDLFAGTLVEDGEPPGPTDYVTSHEAAEQLGGHHIKEGSSGPLLTLVLPGMKQVQKTGGIPQFLSVQLVVLYLSTLWSRPANWSLLHVGHR